MAKMGVIAAKLGVIMRHQASDDFLGLQNCSRSRTGADYTHATPAVVGLHLYTVTSST